MQGRQLQETGFPNAPDFDAPLDEFREPFDRLIVAQARLEGVRVVSRDAALDGDGITRVW